MHQDSNSDGGVARHFGDRVRERRDTIGISQRRLSELLVEKTGVRLDPSAVTRIETGQREPKLSEALAIAQVLGTDIEDLVPHKETAYVDQIEIASELAGSWGQQARRAAAEQAGQYVGIHRIFTAHPELLAQHMFGPSHRKAASADEYLELTRIGIAETQIPLVELVIDAHSRDLIVEVVLETVRSAISKQVGEP
jgi:transcriptional regulator with XRE-family HTH domain